MNIANLIERWRAHAQRRLKSRTLAEYDRLISRLILPALGEHQGERLTLEEVEKWHIGIPGAVQANRALAVLSAILGHAAQRGLIPANPCRGSHRNRERNRERFLTPAESTRLCQLLDSSISPCTRLVHLLLLTGARPGELLTARWEWVQGSVLRLPDAKTGARNIYLSPAALRVMAAHPGEPAPQNGPIFPAGLDIRRAWARIARAAGLEGVRLYDLRHTFASAALGAGVSLDVVGRLLGHRKAQTTLRYAHLAPDVALDAAARAAARMGA